MKILFIYPERGYFTQENRTFWSRRFYYSLGVLVSYLKKNGHQCRILQSGSGFRTALLRKEIRDYKPDIVAITALTHMKNEVCRIASRLRSICPDIPVIYGGMHPSCDPVDAISIRGIDAVCTGEGEIPLLKLLQSGAVFSSSIPGFWFKSRETGEIIRSVNSEFIINLDELPFCDLSESHFYESDDWTVFRRFPVMASRGCLFSCEFCCSSVLKKIHGNQVYRFRSPEHLCEELKMVSSESPGLSLIQFQNDIFFPDLEWLETFCREYRKINIPVSLLLAGSMISDESIRLLKQLPVREIFTGIETSEKRRKQIGKTGTGKVTDGISRLRRAGFCVATFNMLGIPGETEEDYKSGVEQNALNRPAMMQVSYLYPYPGTSVREKSEGKITGKNYVTYFEGSIFKKKFLNARLRFFYHNFVRLVSICDEIENSKKPIWKILFHLIFIKSIPADIKRLILGILCKRFSDENVFRIKF